MAKLTVGTTAVSLPRYGRGKYLVQNLGPGVVYYSGTEVATVATGLMLPVNYMYEFPIEAGTESNISLISDTAGTDVRYTVVGDN